MRRRIILLVLAAVLPILALASGLAIYSVTQQQAAMRDDAVRLAAHILQAAEYELQTQIEVMRALARSPALDGPQPDLATFHQVASRFVRQFPLWSRVILASPDGRQVINTAVPVGVALPKVVDPEGLRRLVETGAPVIGNLTGPGPMQDDGVKVGLRVPVTGPGGEIRFALTVTISPQALAGVFERAGVKSGWRPFLLDASGKIVAHPSTPHRVGQTVVLQTLAARDAAPNGLYRSVASDGVRTIAAFDKSARTGWSAHVSIPEPIYWAPLTRSLLILAAAGLAALALTLLFVWMLRQEMNAFRREQRFRERAGRMDALGRMTGGVAHDFNNLLMVVLGNLEMLRRRLGPAPQFERYLGSIHRAAERGTQLTRELLAFSRGESRQKEIVDLAERVQNVLAMLRQSLQGNIEITVESGGGPYRAELDPIQLDLALLNIAVNARDAMPDGGALTIRIARAAFPDHSGRSGLKLSLSDTGSGVPDDVLPHVFEPFFTTKEVGKGTGLGLSQVYGFAQASSGLADIASRAGRGTVVSLYFPEATATAASPRLATQTVATEMGNGRTHLLLVDDNDDVRTVTSEFLAEAGFHVRAVPGPKAALEALDQEGADIMVSDLVMPGDLDGLGLAEEVRRRRPDLPIVLISGYSASVERARQKGLEVLCKPFEAGELIAAIRAGLGQGRDGLGQDRAAPRASGRSASGA